MSEVIANFPPPSSDGVAIAHQAVANGDWDEVDAPLYRALLANLLVDYRRLEHFIRWLNHEGTQDQNMPGAYLVLTAEERQHFLSIVEAHARNLLANVAAAREQIPSGDNLAN